MRHFAMLITLLFANVCFGQSSEFTGKLSVMESENKQTAFLELPTGESLELVFSAMTTVPELISKKSGENAVVNGIHGEDKIEVYSLNVPSQKPLEPEKLFSKRKCLIGDRELIMHSNGLWIVDLANSKAHEVFPGNDLYYSAVAWQARGEFSPDQNFIFARQAFSSKIVRVSDGKTIIEPSNLAFLRIQNTRFFGRN
jgi:hypothetical protein